MKSVAHWDPNEWEQWCLSLLRTFYGADQVQEMPARHGGDLGIEAFTYSGYAFQCYAAEEPTTVGERYKNQRDKLTRDLKKLITKKEQFTKLLGNTKLTCYFFLVPYYDSKELVLHAQEKGQEYCAAGLSFISHDFRVRVATDDAFQDAKKALLSRPRELLAIDPVSEEELEIWLQANTHIRDTVSTKLSVLFPIQRQREQYVGEVITQYLDSQNYLQELRERYPDQWENASRAKNQLERKLNLEYLSSGEPHTPKLILRIVRELEQKFMTEVPTLDSAAASTLAWGAVGDWLARCPLSFEYAAASA